MADTMPTVEFNDDVRELLDIVFEDYDFIGDFVAHMKQGDGSVVFNRKTLRKTIDESWISAVEQGIGAIDHCIRTPGKDLQEIEEILPIELTRKISSRSIKHLTQHTNLINSIDEEGNVMPSKILNVYKEESFQTYENKFVNTLIDRLYIFMYKRFEQLKIQYNDEYCTQMKFETTFDNNDTEIVVGLNISTRDKKDYGHVSGQSADALAEIAERQQALMERAERLMKIVSSFKASPFVQKLGNSYIRPPVMRTNAILKNQYLKQCLVLWQFIESYNSIGFDVAAKETAEKPPADMIQTVYSLLALQYMLFRQSTVVEPEGNVIEKTRKSDAPVSPKIISDFHEQLVDDYNFYDVENKKVLAIFPGKSKRRLSKDEMSIRVEIDRSLAAERQNKARDKKQDANPAQQV